MGVVVWDDEAPELMRAQTPSLRTTHIRFSVVYCTALYIVCNAVNVDRLTRWFQGAEGLNLWAFVAYCVAGLLLFIAFFALLAHRHTIKPLAIVLVIVSAFATYFIAKYDVAIDTSMLQNAASTDALEVRQLMSLRMLPMLAFTIPVVGLIAVSQVTFDGGASYLLRSVALSVTSVVAATAVLYTNFNAVQRAGNVSNKYIVWSLVPVNVLWSTISLGANAAKPLLVPRRNPADLRVAVTRSIDLTVVLAIGESSRQASFSLYGYTRQGTNPELGTVPDIHVLNGIAKRASTIYALPQILEKDGFKLAAVTSKAGIPTTCYVNFTMYDNCDAVGEVKPHPVQAWQPVLRRGRHTAAGSTLAVTTIRAGLRRPALRRRQPWPALPRPAPAGIPSLQTRLRRCRRHERVHEGRAPQCLRQHHPVCRSRRCGRHPGARAIAPAIRLHLRLGPRRVTARERRPLSRRSARGAASERAA